MAETFLKLSNIGKEFAGVPALRGVSLSIDKGEIMGLVGANGAGKSTLMRITAGNLQPDSGEIEIEGSAVRFRNPRAALRVGIAFVAQEVQLPFRETVGRSLLLWNLPSRAGVVRGHELRARSRELLDRVGLTSVDPDDRVDELTPVQQRLLTVAEAISKDPRLLILDEPSAALPVEVTDSLFPVIESLCGGGTSVIYISHRLHEIQRIADSVTVMRDGQVVAIMEREDRSVRSMVNLISGKAQEEEPAPIEVADLSGEAVVDARGLCGIKVRDATFKVHAGEILGIGGLHGSGRSELLRLVGAVQRPRSGRVEVLGGTPSSPSEAARRGVGYLAEGRGRMVLPGMDVVRNAGIASMSKRANYFLINGRKERQATESVARRLDLKGDLDAEITTLSGGNQQKVMLGRWLLRESRLFILDEPTVGIDVGTRAEIHTHLRGLAKEGAAVLVASAEPEELCLLCDRVLVLVEGRLGQEFRAPFEAKNLVAASYARDAA